jgi:hypothetical protein
MNARTQTSEAVRVRSIETDSLHNMAVAGLILLGLALLVLGGVVWLDTTAPGASKVGKTSTTIVSKQGLATTTTVRSTDTTTPGKSTLRSETVAGTLFGLGALLFLCGLFFGRISEVTLPGGAGFKLDPAAQAKVVAKVAERAQQTKGLEPEPETMQKLYTAAIQELLRTRATTPGTPQTQGPGGTPTPELAAGASGWGTSPSDDVIDAAVDAAVKQVAD